MAEKMIQRGVVGVRSPDDRTVIKTVPLYRLADDQDVENAVEPIIDFAALSYERMREAMQRELKQKYSEENIMKRARARAARRKA